MFVPFGAIPCHLMEPLLIDTTLQYNLRRLKVPKAKDGDSNQTLVIAPSLCEISSSSSESPFLFSFCDNRPEIAELAETPETITDWESFFAQGVSGFEEVECPLQDTGSCDWLSCSLTSHSECCSSNDICSSVILSQEKELETMPTKAFDTKQFQNLSDMYLGAPLQFKRNPQISTDKKSNKDTCSVMGEEMDSLFTNPIEMRQCSINSEYKPIEWSTPYKHQPMRSSFFSNTPFDRSTDALRMTREETRRDTVSGLHDILFPTESESDSEVVTYAILTNVAHIWETPLSSLPQ